MRNLILGLLLYLSYYSRNIDADIIPVDETYTVEPNEPFTIRWEYDNEASMFFVSWTYKNSSSLPITTEVMSQLTGNAAVPAAGFAINHEQNGNITLQNVTDSYSGIYYCIVTYTGMSGLSPVTGTATIELKIVPEEDKNKCDTKCKNGVVGGVVGVGGVTIICIGCAVAWLKKKKEVWIVVIPNDGTWQEETCHVGPSNGANCVQEVRRGGPADKKLKKGDRILSINGKSTTGKSIENINKQLKIPPTVLELTIKRGKEERNVTLDFKGKALSGIAFKKEKEDIVVSAIEPESAAASGDVKEQDCILSVNGVSTAGMKVGDIKDMLTFSIILKVTKDFTLKELDPDKDGSFGFETFLPSTSTSVTVNNQTAVTTVTPERPANVVKSVTTNGPANLHGIKPGDTIVSINNEETKGKSHQEIKAMLETFGTSISLKIAENDKPNQTNGHGGNDIEMGHVNPRAQDSGRVQTLETTEEKQDFMKPLLDDKC